MTTNNTLTTLYTLKQYNDSGITVTFKNHHDLPCLTVCYVNQQFQINFLIDASILTFLDADSTYHAIERAVQ